MLVKACALFSWQVIQHIRLNRAESPCEEAEDYRFADCIMVAVASQVGCQSFWSNYPGLPTCSSLKQIINLMENFQEMMTMEKYNLTRVSGCRDPCTYMEYKVICFTMEWSGKVKVVYVYCILYCIPRTVEYLMVKLRPSQFNNHLTTY